MFQQIPTLVDNESDSLVIPDSERTNLLNHYFCSITRLDDGEEELPNLEKNAKVCRYTIKPERKYSFNYRPISLIGSREII